MTSPKPGIACDGPIAVSVIIPTYNRADLLLHAVRSVLDQTLHGVEIIVVDDGSVDGTLDAVAALRSQITPAREIVYLRQDRGGASRARNLGLAHARGRFIQFLDSDDILLPRKLETQVALLDAPENAQAAACYTRGVAGEFSGAGAPSSGREIGICAGSPEELLALLVGRQAHVMCTAAPLWRAAFLRSQNGWNQQIGIGDDLEYHVRLVCAAPGVRCVPDVLFAVREHGGGRLGGDALDAARVESLVTTRRLVHDALVARGCWSAAVRAEFLSAMRTVYANTLQLGRPEVVRATEAWLTAIACPWWKFTGIRSAIVLRSVLGARTLLALVDLAQTVSSALFSRLKQLTT